MNYHYPNNIQELREGDTYQIQYPMTNIWSDDKIYSKNICDTKKQNLQHLIDKTRLRIIK
jgi:hypothetical protein